LKLLFDENLSPKLVSALSNKFPDSKHVDRIGLGSEPDSEVWEYAKTNGFILVSKDSDFHDKSTSFGHPPKVIWIRRGNCSNRQIELLLRNKVDIIKSFNDNAELSIIEFN
jgi:predicted nuclease of predicted toxin-antitoxin system